MAKKYGYFLKVVSSFVCWVCGPVAVIGQPNAYMECIFSFHVKSVYTHNIQNYTRAMLVTKVVQVLGRIASHLEGHLQLHLVVNVVYI